MTSNHFNRAKYPLRIYSGIAVRIWAKVVLSILLLGLLVPFLVGCGLQAGGQAVSTGSSTTQQQSTGQLTYVAIGASDTFGIGTDDPYDQNWATQLALKLGPRYHLINLGVPSIVIHRALTTELPVALDAHPDLVTIWLAVDDIANNVPVNSYSQDLDQMLSRLHAVVPHVRIAVANVPDLTLLPYFYSQNSIDLQALRTEVQAYDRAIASIVARHHAILVDLYQHNYDILNHPEYISSDGLHPTAIGYARIADVFYQALQENQG
jgi:lysophospholipase L1-like esterase